LHITLYWHWKSFGKRMYSFRMIFTARAALFFLVIALKMQLAPRPEPQPEFRLLRPPT